MYYTYRLTIPNHRLASLPQRKTYRQTVKTFKDFVVRRSFIILLLPYYHQFYCKTFSLILVCEYDCKNELYKVWWAINSAERSTVHMSYFYNICHCGGGGSNPAGPKLK